VVKSMSPETKVGLLFFLVLLLVGATAAFLGDWVGRLSSYQIVVHFADVKGLQPGADVKLAGVRIGKVTHVALAPSAKFPDQPVGVQLAINRRVALYDSDKFFIEQATLLGESFVSVRRMPASKEGRRPLKRLKVGMEIAGSGTAGFSALPDTVERVMKQAELAVAGARATYFSEYNAQQVKAILDNLVAVTARANQIAGQAAQLVEALSSVEAGGRPKIGAILDKLNGAASDIQQITKSLRQALAINPIPMQLTIAATNIRQASEDLRGTMAEVRKLTTSEQTQARLQGLLENMSAAAQNIEQLTGGLQELTADGQLVAGIKQTVANLQEASSSIKRTSASIEQMLGEPAFQEDVRTTVQNLRQASERGTEVVRKADATLTRVDATMDRVSALARQFQPTRTTAISRIEGTDDRGLRADLDLHLQYGLDPRKYWLIGIRDIGDAEGLDLQRAIPIGGRSVGRMGIIGSKLGVGYYHQVSDRLGIEGELWDPQELFLDLRAVMGLRDGWRLTLGLADALGEVKPQIGVRKHIVISDHTSELQAAGKQ